MSNRTIVGTADALTILCAFLAAALALFGAYRSEVFGALVSIRWTHALFAAAAVAALRHAVAPSPSLPSIVGAGARRLRERRALHDAVLAFSLTRPAVLLVGLLAVGAFGAPAPAADIAGRDRVASLPLRFDTGWYAGIADDGYEWQHRFDRQQNLAFFPAYPALMRAAGTLVGAADSRVPRERRIVRYAWTGVVISLGAFFWAAWYLSRIARELLDDERATVAVLLLASYPFAIFYSAAYSESLYLLAALGAWYHFRHADWTRAAMWGLLAGLSRPNGFFLTLPLALLAIGVRDAAGGRRDDSMDGRQASDHGSVSRTRTGRIAPLAAAAMPVAGMLIFTLYVFQLTDVWFAWARMHQAWGRSFDADAVLAAAPIGSAAGLLHVAAARPFETLNALGLGFALAMAWPVWRRLGPPWAAFVLVNVLPPLAAGGVLSMGRLTSTLFPLFLALAAHTPPRAAIAWAAGFGALQGLAAALFFTWRELF